MKNKKIEIITFSKKDSAVQKEIENKKAIWEQRGWDLEKIEKENTKTFCVFVLKNEKKWKEFKTRQGILSLICGISALIFLFQDLSTMFIFLAFACFLLGILGVIPGIRLPWKLNKKDYIIKMMLLSVTLIAISSLFYTSQSSQNAQIIEKLMSLDKKMQDINCVAKEFGNALYLVGCKHKILVKDSKEFIYPESLFAIENEKIYAITDNAMDIIRIALREEEYMPNEIGYYHNANGVNSKRAFVELGLNNIEDSNPGYMNRPLIRDVSDKEREKIIDKENRMIKSVYCELPFTDQQGFYPAYKRALEITKSGVDLSVFRNLSIDSEPHTSRIVSSENTIHDFVVDVKKHKKSEKIKSITMVAAPKGYTKEDRIESLESIARNIVAIIMTIEVPLDSLLSNLEITNVEIIKDILLDFNLNKRKPGYTSMKFIRNDVKYVIKFNLDTSYDLSVTCAAYDPK